MKLTLLFLALFWSIAFAQPTWVDSGAPIGDTSIYVYTGAWAGVELNMDIASEDTISVSNISGTPDGFHLYRVNAAPNYTAGLPGGTIRNGVYWGVFPVNGTTPGYDISIHYGTNSNLTGANEPTITVYNRNANDITSWAELGGTIDDPNNNIAFSFTEREEFILDSIIPLPIENLQLSARLQTNNKVGLKWTTDKETGTATFELERSLDGKYYQSISTTAAAGYSDSRSTYTYEDEVQQTARIYYRVKQIDLDGASSYSNLATVVAGKNSTLAVFPSPLEDRLYVSAQVQEDTPVRIILTDALGRKIISHDASLVPGQLFIINTAQLGAGAYHLAVYDLGGQPLHAQKVLKY